MKLPDLPFKLPDLPRHVMLSIAVIAGSAVFYVVLLLTLASSRDAAVTDFSRLEAESAQLKKNLAQSKADFSFVQENREKYDALMKSDRLVPHTRVTAVRRLQELARREGLTTLNYEFSGGGETSPAAAMSQGASGDYRVNVETIKLKVGAAVDGKIYRFLRDISNDFPGAAVVQVVDLARAPAVSADALNSVAAGRESLLVTGEVTFLWRTAQATDKKPEGGR